MSGMISIGGKFVEKFFCHCGKECRSVKIARSPGSKVAAGMHWICDDKHVERDCHHKDERGK